MHNKRALYNGLPDVVAVHVAGGAGVVVDPAAVAEDAGAAAPGVPGAAGAQRHIRELQGDEDRGRGAGAEDAIEVEKTLGSYWVVIE